MAERIEASPTKEFFVRMIVKDISLEDCIFDLLDNCLDGARNLISATAQAAGQVAQGGNGAEGANGNLDGRVYQGYQASLTINAEEFIIEDNCGGITIEEATNYAFRFGRRLDAPHESDFAIGLYGIGMKRAVFKMGDVIRVDSSTSSEAFIVNIDVNEWLALEGWDLALERNDVRTPAGTLIRVTNLHREVREEFTDPVFINKLRTALARDYSFFLQQGFTVNVNGVPVTPYEFRLLEGRDFAPVKREYQDDTGVHVEITAGLAAPPIDDATPESREMQFSEVAYYGWFVLCNDRVVLAADKSSRTVWGDENFPVWHPQYNGFMGIASFRSADPNLLPWTTTKREIDITDLLYRRAVQVMKEVTRAYIDYTIVRKLNLEEAKILERRAVPTPIFRVEKRETIVLPRLSTSRMDLANISYQKPKSKLLKAAEALGNRNLSYREVGSRTFDYFFKQEVEE